MQRMHVFVKGKVQGVFFRAHMRLEAGSRSITGWVKNLPDGSVEGIIEGTASDLATMLEWCHQGPPGAFVSYVEATHEPYVGNYQDFSIIY